MDQDPASYEIRVAGELGGGWADWFGGFEVSSDALGCTTIRGRVCDQAELYGLLARVRDLGLPLIGLRRLDGESGRQDT